MIREWMGEMGLGCLTWLPLPVVFGGGAVVALLSVVAASVAAVFFGGSFVFCCGGTLLVLAIDRATGAVEPVSVVGHQWERSIYIREVVVKDDSDWCHNLPDGAVETDRRRKFHHREKRVGRDRSVYEDWCEYRVAEWDDVSPLQRSGEGTDARWPELGNTECTKVGCRREIRREEELDVVFDRASGHNGAPWACKMNDETEWRAWSKGDRAALLIGGFVGAPYCDQLTRRGPARKAPLEPKPKPKPGPAPRKRKKSRRKKR